MKTKLATVIAQWTDSIDQTPTKYQVTKFAEGFRRSQRQRSGAIVSSACPYGTGDGNVSFAEWAWTAGYEFSTR